MRQAGRYLPEYRRLRERHSLLELCRTPELAAEVTLQPVKRVEVDAAIIFSDLLLPLDAMGLSVDFVAGEGPVIANALKAPEDVQRLHVVEPRESLAFTFEAIRLAKQALAGRVPLIGFAGAPFTLASYAIEGGPARTFASTKALMYSNPPAWHDLCERLATVVTRHLEAQIEAGVDAVQVFDSWVGTLGAEDYREFVKPHTARIFEALAGRGVPTIHFGTGTADLLVDMREAGGDVIGADWRLPLDVAWERIGHDRAIQGNLDPTLLLGPMERLRQGATLVLDRAADRPGHIFNLGHGILPSTPVEHVQALARHVHRFGPRHGERRLA